MPICSMLSAFPKCSTCHVFFDFSKCGRGWNKEHLEADVNKQIEVLNDTLTVVPDTRNRLNKYVQELKTHLDENFKGVTGEDRGRKNDI